MKQIITTRLMHWKKQWVSLVFWLLFPLLATICITLIAAALQDDTNVPVGVVLEEDTDASRELVEEVRRAPFIRLKLLNQDEALYELEKHELDSVFVIHEGFKENIQEDNRNKLITSYQSDLSFAYQPVKEMIISYVQQETGRVKAAFTVNQLEQEYNSQANWTFEEIVAKSKEIQKNENLLNTDFSFPESPAETTQNTRLFSIWGLWGVFNLLSTWLLFDWVIKEKRSKAILRLAFTRFSLKAYLIQNFLHYFILILLTDLLSAVIFYWMFGEWISIANILIYRFFAAAAAFLVAHLFSNTFVYYTSAFAFVLIVSIGSGAILPASFIGGLAWFDLINPLAPLLSGEYISLWTVLITIFAFLWIIRKDRYHA
ncbi:ABC-2 type transport system permease protein [Lentibacillus persicus]|uniref:ABC-2 type transport system permease protein n=1 Tax=Lentibacillus persicus TaxID=640948 RepID=A0A1I1TT63_9BACI|nr:ABC transporter permease [Lentibacillus persicus]SFD59653.1 ABC-2 type transport system permease protein [Lentibacillus persicus]